VKRGSDPVLTLFRVGYNHGMKRKSQKKLSSSIRKPVPKPTKVERDRRADIEREEAEREMEQAKKKRRDGK
jgi:hypothetical protein